MFSPPANRKTVVVSSSSRAAVALGLVGLLSSPSTSSFGASAKLADRGRLQSARKQRHSSGRRKVRSDVASSNLSSNRSSPIVEEPKHRVSVDISKIEGDARRSYSPNGNSIAGSIRGAKEVSMKPSSQWQEQQIESDTIIVASSHDHRQLSSQLTGCCTTYTSYSATDMCSLYGEDCESGDTPSHDSGDESCEQVGLSFIGISFSVNTMLGNPHSYQLCDQFPMENIIDRSYEYVMSMDEDGWLVGGGYKSFDYSGKMP